MRPQLASRTSGLVRSYGTLKWFGGVNSKTGRENHFGFIEDLSGKDVFLHRGEWRGTTQPAEGDQITFLKEERDGKFSARGAERLDTASIGAWELFPALCAPAPNAGTLVSSDIRLAIEKKLQDDLAASGPDDLRRVLRLSQETGAPSIFEVVAGGVDAPRNYELLMQAGGISITDAAPWAALSSRTASHFEADIAAQLESLAPQAAREKCLPHLTILPSSLLTYLVTRGVFTTSDELAPSSLKKVYDYLGSVIIREKTTFPDYLRASFDASLGAPHCGPSDPVLRDIVDYLRFKKSLFEKNSDFVSIYNGSNLNRNLETFVLYNLLGLIAAGNDDVVVYGVFMQRLWQALTSKSLTFHDRPEHLQALFPPCATMGPKLSCEAVHWAKQDRFLCRGKICGSPSVLPRPARHFLEFNAYDWLDHYGVKYMASDRPQARDFPIKLASYFNRLREVLPLLYCRTCNELMLPNLKYSRTQYKESINGVIEVKEMAAAYRLTVFHCNNGSCEQFEVGRYISHCLGFGCYHVVDSRDLKQQCSKGRYVCKGCGSCCPDHAQSHPVGLCAECGDELEVLSEEVRGRQTTYTRKFVKCKSGSCNFTIGGDNLPTKFSRLPVNSDPGDTDQGDSFDLA